MSRNVLITGAAGFLGSHLSDAYLAAGDTVCGLDNFSTGASKNLDHLNDNQAFSFIEHDITEDLPKQVLDQKWDVILNMASPASPPHYQRLGIETLMVGAVGTLNMLELAHRDGARFFHASTSEVYGDPEIHPQPETYKGSVNCYGPRSMYDESKRYAEALIYTHRKKYGTNTCVARFFNTYGPRMDANDGRVVSNFIVQALRGHDLTIYGDGGQTRSFCYVDDLVKGIMSLIDSKESDPINLGNPGEFTIKELADIVLDKIDSSCKLTFQPLPGDDPLQRKPVIEMATKKLGWKPTIALSEGLELTIDYFKADLGLV
jgi:nucleoside-diphosphate-sugar epimerase